jgi:hypothetical protein
MKPLRPLLFATLGSAALLLGTADAKPDKEKDKGKGGDKHAEKGNKGKPDKAEKHADKQIEKADKRVAKDLKKGKAPKFKDTDRTRVLGYFATYRNEAHGLPPGLAKNLRRGKPLPPGWQKKLQPGWVVTDDWWGDFSPVPHEWFPEVEVVEDTRLYWYGDRIVRVYEPRREVIDVIIVPTIRVDW